MKVNTAQSKSPGRPKQGFFLLGLTVSIIISSVASDSNNTDNTGTGRSYSTFPRTARSYNLNSIGKSGGTSNYWTSDTSGSSSPGAAAAAAVVGMSPSAVSVGRDGGGGGGYDGGGDHGQGGGAAASGQSAYGVPAPMSSYGGQAQPMVFYYQNVPSPGMMASGSGSGWGMGGGIGTGGGWGSGGMDDDDDDGGDLSSLVGLLGLKGLKGLKGAKAGLKALKAVKALKALLLLPLLLPLLLLLLIPLLLLLLLPLLLLLLIPVPVVVPGRSLNLGGLNPGFQNSTAGFDHRSASSSSTFFGSAEDYNTIFESFLNSTDCIEKISCEISRIGKNYKHKEVDSFKQKIQSKIAMLGPTIASKIGAGSSKSDDGCTRYTCMKSIF